MQNTNSEESQIVLYQPDETISIEVKLKNDTVWLNRVQIAALFDRDVKTIGKHINNALKEELAPLSTGTTSAKNPTVAKFATVQIEGKREINRQVEYYNLDVVLSVGYRVKSSRGIQFRRWANSILKEYILQGYAVSRHLLLLQQQMDNRMNAIEFRQDEQQKQLDFFIKTSTPPAEMVFFNGEFFTARVAIENLIKTATSRAIIIDHYVDAKTFDMFDVRQPGVEGVIYTQGVGSGMIRLKEEHDRQKNVQPVEVYKWRVEPHDRFLIIDDRLYHCGHSLNATGGKLSAIMLMGTSPETILEKMI